MSEHRLLMGMKGPNPSSKEPSDLRNILQERAVNPWIINNCDYLTQGRGRIPNKEPQMLRIFNLSAHLFFLTTIFSLDHFPLSPQPLAEILLLEDVIGAVSDLSEIIFSSANCSRGGDELAFPLTRRAEEPGLSRSL